MNATSITIMFGWFFGSIALGVGGYLLHSTLGVAMCLVASVSLLVWVMTAWFIGMAMGSDR